MDIRMEAHLDFNYKLWPSIKQRIFQNADEAMRIYIAAVKRKISIWGSIPVLAGRFVRKRVKHSRPGQPPLRQTSNLYNSIQIYSDSDDFVNFNPKTNVFKVRGYTDVEYAMTLEQGGIAVNDYGQRKKHSSIHIINPLKRPVYFIAPRPVWLPVWNTYLYLIFDKIRRI